MSNDLTLCPICRSALESHRLDANTDIFLIQCPRCGRFEVTYEFIEDVVPNVKAGQESRDLVLLSGAIRRNTDLHKRFRQVITTSNWQQLVLASGAPKDVNGQIDALVVAIAERAPFYGDWTPVEPVEPWIARAYLPSDSNLTQLIGVMGKLDLTHSSGSTDGLAFYLGLAGWERLRAIQAQGNLASGQAFVAMWFHEEMDAVFDNGIVPALVDCGLQPYRVDRDNHDNKIDDEIVAQIRRSRLLVADCSGERAGVYFEAGFALGLNIPVIWCCNSSWKTKLPATVEPNSLEAPKIEEFKWSDRLHFDTRQYPHLLWKDTNELREMLTNRIKALNLDLPKSSA